MPAWSLRRPTRDDAALVLAVHAAQNTPLIGTADATLDDVAADLGEPGVELDEDAWLALDDTGTPVGWALAYRAGEGERVGVALAVAPGHPGLDEQLWTLAEQRARALGAPGTDAVRSTAVLATEAYRADVARAALAARHGMARTATFWRMRVEHDAARPLPEPPAGVEVRTGDVGESVRRDALALRNHAFAGHAGMVAREYDEWVGALEANRSHDWSLTSVAYVDGEPAAVLVGTNVFVPDENCGYVLNLGTHERHRGRGLASFLLHRAFAVDAARGRAGTILHVDTDPQRPALGLYERSGMRPVLTIDLWEKAVACP